MNIILYIDRCLFSAVLLKYSYFFSFSYGYLFEYYTLFESIGQDCFKYYTLFESTGQDCFKVLFIIATHTRSTEIWSLGFSAILFGSIKKYFPR